MTKVQLSLTDQETAILTSYGSRFGYNLPKTIRYVISKASEEFLKEGAIPTYAIGDKTERVVIQALEDHKKGKTCQIEDIDEFLDSL